MLQMMKFLLLKKLQKHLEVKGVQIKLVNIFFNPPSKASDPFFAVCIYGHLSFQKSSQLWNALASNTFPES